MLTTDVHAGRGRVAPPPARRDGDPRRRAYVAAFVCHETERLGREVGFPVAVISVTADVERHAARLAATLYGAWSPRDYVDWALPFDEGYAIPRDLAYRQMEFDPRWMGSSELPENVSIEAGCLSARLPQGVAVGDLAVLLRSGLAKLAFDRVARRPDRVRHRHFTRRQTVVAPRYALIVPGDIDRVVAADDLYGFRPGDLAKVAEASSLAVDALALAAAAGRLQGASGAREASHV